MTNLHTLPKVELHCHLDGIIDLAMVTDIHRNDPTYPIQPDYFAQAYPVNGYQSFWRWWQFIDPIEGELDYFRPILGRYIERLKAQNVRYFELMVAQGELPDDPASAIDKLKEFREWVDDQEAGVIQVEFLIAVNRRNTPERFAQMGRKVMALYEAGLIVGVALAGPEKGNPIKPLHKTFVQFHEAGLGIEVHAGEWCGPDSVWDALEHGYPHRIGHGVNLFKDPKLIELFQEQQIHIEFCPTSNLLTNSVTSIEEHPIVKARELGLNFSVNTDDPGSFGCSMTSEYQLLAEVFGFRENDFQQIYENSLQARFQPDLRLKLT